MAKLKTTPFDASEHLATEEAQARFLADAFEEGDPAYIAHAIGIVAKARGMTKIARDADVTREALYRALSSDGDPRLSTLMGVMRSLGLKLTVAAGA
jgi:probable addiction module antidote protein